MGTEAGWPAFFRTLRLYLTHCGGQRSAVMKWMVPVVGTEAQAWDLLTTALKLQGLSVGRSCTAAAAVPALSGVVAYLSHSPFDALLQVDQRGPGIAALGALSFGDQSLVALAFYLYGDAAAATAARETPLRDVWFAKHFPLPAPASPRHV